MNVQHHSTEQPCAKDPQKYRARQDGHEELAEELGVVIEVLFTEVHLQVADHVGDHKTNEEYTGDRHHVLLANCS